MFRCPAFQFHLDKTVLRSNERNPLNPLSVDVASRARLVPILLAFQFVQH